MSPSDTFSVPFAADATPASAQSGSRHSAIDDLLSRTPGLWQGRQRPAASHTARNNSAPVTGDLFEGLEQPPAQAVADTSRDPAALHLPRGQSTGSPRLDAALPWAGWPPSGLIEVITPHPGIGELQLLLPLLRERSQGHQSILWITPPYDLNGAMLSQSGMNLRNSFVIPASARCNQALWSIEKALQSAECTLVLAWQNWLSPRVLRRLQMAAAQGNTLGVLFHQRPVANSPACLQLRLSSVARYPDGQRHLGVQLLKARGSHQRTQVNIPLPC